MSTTGVVIRMLGPDEAAVLEYAATARAESERLADLLRHARDEDGKSVLVVEHNMRFVLGLCEYIYVLDWGRILAEGPPSKIRADPLVRAAYLGEGIDDHGAAARA